MIVWVERAFVLEVRTSSLFLLSNPGCISDSACQRRGKRQLTCEHVGLLLL